MRHAIGFFEVDCRERNDAGDGLRITSRMAPLEAGLNRLHERARQLNAPLVCTTCCSRRMLDGSEQVPGVLQVPLEAAQREWEARVPQYREFYLHKKTYGVPQQNFVCRAFDVFQDNSNAVRLIQMLGVREWLVFGAAWDICVNASTRGLLAAGQQVSLLMDVTVPAAKGYGESGTEENRQRVLAELCGLGARTGTLDKALAALAC